MKARTILVPAVTTSSATYYTVPANTRARLIYFHAAHTATSSATVMNASIKVGSAVTPIFLAKSLAVGITANAAVSDSSYMMLESGTLIVAHADNVNCSLIITVEETPYLVSTN